MTEEHTALPRTFTKSLRHRAADLALTALSIPLVLLTLCAGFWAAVIWLGGIVLLGTLMAVFAAVGVAAGRGAPTVDRVLARKDLSDSPAAFSLEGQGLAARGEVTSGRKDSSGPTL